MSANRFPGDIPPYCFPGLGKTGRNCYRQGATSKPSASEELQSWIFCRGAFHLLLCCGDGPVGCGYDHGFVIDQSGAVVPAAKVTVTNEGTGETRRVTSDAQGRYTVPNLPPTAYTVTVEAGGFREVRQQQQHPRVQQYDRHRCQTHHRASDPNGRGNRHGAAPSDAIRIDTERGHRRTGTKTGTEWPQSTLYDAIEPWGYQHRHAGGF